MLSKENNTVQGSPAPAPTHVRDAPLTPEETAANNEIMNWITEESPVPGTDQSLDEFLASPEWDSSPLFGSAGDSFDPQDTPMMPTPTLDMHHGDQPLFAFTDGSPDIYTSPHIVDSHSFESMSGVGVADFPLMAAAPADGTYGKDIAFGDEFWDIPEPIPESVRPISLHNGTSPSITIVQSAPTQTTAPMQLKEKKWTGTRPNVTPSTLIPLDAPVQPREYLAPSATSRKAVPAAFTQRRSTKRGHEEVDVEGDVDEELKRQIEAKRLQNTKAARRSRARKLQYQTELENEIQRLQRENEQLKARLTVLGG